MNNDCGLTELFIDIKKPDIDPGFFMVPDQNKSSNTKEINDEWLKLVSNFKKNILECPYNLTINLVDVLTIQRLNHQWRDQNKPTDILSFSYSQSEGEIFLCPSVIKGRHLQYDRDLGNFVLYLIVHGLHHLAGYEHGVEMEEAEEKIRHKFHV